MRQYVFGTLSPKRPSESALISFEWFPAIVNYWQPGVVYAQNSYVRPLSPTGWAYQRIEGGMSGATEPAWPKQEGGTVIDGSGAWTAVESGSNAVTSPASPVVTAVPADLTLGAPTLVDGEAPGSRVQVLISGGVSGIRYFVRSMITAGDELLEGTVVFPIDDSV